MGRDDWCAVVRVVRDWGYIPMHAEVLAEDRVIWLAGFATLKVTKKGGSKWTIIKKPDETKSRRTMCRISFEKVKRRTASMRSRGFSCSLILLYMSPPIIVNGTRHNGEKGERHVRGEKVRSVEVMPIFKVGYWLEQRRG